MLNNMIKKTFTLLICLLSLLSFSQTYYSENFESGNGALWNMEDLDQDGNYFGILNASGVNANFGTKTLVSFSWNSSAFTPDNLAISPAITLPSGVPNIFLTYDVQSDADTGAENYAVYLTSSDVAADVIAATPILEETLPGGLKQVSLDISAFAGQTVHLSFRHFNCTDQYYLALDNIAIKTLSNDNATNVKNKLDKFIAINTSKYIQTTIKNNGSNTINSVEVNWNDGTDHIATIPVSITAGNTAVVDHPVAVNYSDIAQKIINLTITKVNGNTDSDPTDNSGNLSTVVVSQVVPRKPVFEEGTGTWCGWCTRGIVALQKLETDFPNDQISIAVHNGDPMVLSAYNSGAGFSSFPGMNVDRELKGIDISPSTISSYVTTRKTLPTPVQLSGTYTISGTTLTVNASAKFFSNFSAANYRLAAIVKEDDVHGTTSTYAQKNYYAGGAYGVMGGFESMPSTIPAASMYYKHVGRALLGGYAGQTGSVPATITDQQTVNYTFTYTIPTTYVADKLKVVLLLIDQTDGTIVNGENMTKTTLATTDVSLAKSTVVYPNPAKNDVFIKFEKNGKYNVTIFDMSGREVKNFGEIITVNSNVQLPINGLLPGKYIINISQKGVSYSKELIVK